MRVARNMPMENHLHVHPLLVAIQSLQICAWFQYCDRCNVISHIILLNHVRQNPLRNTTRHPFKIGGGVVCFVCCCFFFFFFFFLLLLLLLLLLSNSIATNVFVAFKRYNDQVFMSALV